MELRKRMSLGKHARINISKSGVSFSTGIKGVSLNIGKKGTFLNTSLPGTGLYERTKLSGKK